MDEEKENESEVAAEEEHSQDQETVDNSGAENLGEDGDEDLGDEQLKIGGDIMDISNSYAIKHLEKLVTTGQLTETRAERLKSKYEKLYQMVLKIFESERMLLGKARQLHKEVLGDKKKFGRFQESQKEEKNELDKLRAELAKAETDRQMVEEQVMIKSLEQAELKRQLKDADDDMRRMEQERMEQLEPKLRALNAELDTLNEEIELCGRRAQTTTEEKITTNARIQQMSKEVETADKEKGKVLAVLEKTRNDPEKLARQASVVEGAVNGLKSDLEEQSIALEQLKADVLAHDTKRGELEEELATLKSRYHKFQSVVETRALALQEIETEIEYQRDEDSKTRQKLAELDNRMNELHKKRKEEDDGLGMLRKEEAQHQRREVVLSSKLQGIQNTTQPYKIQQEDLLFELKDGESDKHKLENELEEMRKDVDILIHQFLIAEKMSQEGAANVSASKRTRRISSKELRHAPGAP